MEPRKPFVRRYFLYSQIKIQYDGMGLEQKVITLTTAFEIKEIHLEYSKDVCIAMAMGYKACISGSGYFEKIN